MTITQQDEEEENTKMLLSFKFLDNTRSEDNLIYERDLLISPKLEAEDKTPFSFAFSGLHDGGAMPIPLPQPSLDEKDRLIAHIFYGHLVDVLKEGKSSVDTKITALSTSQLQTNQQGQADEVLVPVSKKAKISNEEDGYNEEDEEKEEVEEEDK